MKAKAATEWAVCCLVLVVCTGCTVTSFELTGTKGAEFRGEYTDAGGRCPWNGKLPDSNWQASLGIIGFNRLQRCDFRKEDTNALLVLRLKTHGFKGSIAAPPGTKGVRVTRDGKKMAAECF